ncbi:MAG: hypothetical protein JNG84_06575 [Archangium sp.]|nr:hypothetical protein [Archangium sp.]
MGKVAVNFPKSPVTDGSGAKSLAPMNPHKFPAAPAPFVVAPLPGMGTEKGSDLSTKTTFDGSFIGSPKSKFDGKMDISPLKGLIVPTTEGICKRMVGSIDTKVEGNPVSTMLDMATYGDMKTPGKSGSGKASEISVSEVEAKALKEKKYKEEELPPCKSVFIHVFAGYRAGGVKKDDAGNVVMENGKPVYLDPEDAKNANDFKHPINFKQRLQLLQKADNDRKKSGGTGGIQAEDVIEINDFLLFTGHIAVSLETVNAKIRGFGPNVHASYGDADPNWQKAWYILNMLKGQYVGRGLDEVDKREPWDGKSRSQAEKMDGSYIGELTDDTAVFSDAKKYKLRYEVQELVYAEPEFNKIKAEYDKNDGEKTKFRYSFPPFLQPGEKYEKPDPSAGGDKSAGHPPKGGDCNCATFPAKAGVRIPEKSGQVQSYIEAIAATRPGGAAPDSPIPPAVIGRCKGC